jgi:hypothetical protein
MKALYDTAVDNLAQQDISAVKDAAKESASSIFDTARNNPKTTAAIILGTSLAAAALWVLREPQRLRQLKKGVSGYLGVAKKRATK